MPMIISPESELGKEMAKWEKPYVYRPYPKMLYKAQKVNGKVVCIMPAPSQFGWRDSAEYQQAILWAESVTAQNQRTVETEEEHHRARTEGWRETPQAALAHFDALEREIGQAAAEANFYVQGMSETARAEHAIATDQTHEHVTDVQPVRNERGRAAKGVVAVSGKD